MQYIPPHVLHVYVRDVVNFSAIGKFCAMRNVLPQDNSMLSFKKCLSLLDSIVCGAQWVGPYTYIIKWKKESIKDSGYSLTPAFHII